jgi:hypothetical protein
MVPHCRSEGRAPLGAQSLRLAEAPDCSASIIPTPPKSSQTRTACSPCCRSTPAALLRGSTGCIRLQPSGPEESTTIERSEMDRHFVHHFSGQMTQMDTDEEGMKGGLAALHFEERPPTGADLKVMRNGELLLRARASGPQKQLIRFAVHPCPHRPRGAASCARKRAGLRPASRDHSGRSEDRRSQRGIPVLLPA